MKPRVMPRLFLLISAVAIAGTTDSAHACEPAAFDFPSFFRDNDADRDGYLQRDELLSARYQTSQYGNKLNVPVNTAQAFAQLDRNRDARLSLDELWEWGVHTHNSCADWPSPDRPSLFQRMVDAIGQLLR